ncbi:MAG: hypothetical protein D6800_02795 [Candidatus Zixiibacteriota bacterium]|nr:MAG: hypothetical protein D6800_02795 [candidate division Zixibacteria bacterium]
MVDKLSGLLELIHVPLAVRSSSLLEDSRYQPFAGIYSTYMIPNSHPERSLRLWELTNAIKAVYASTYRRRARGYFEATNYRLEDERMAVIIQLLVGSRHENRFYPNLAGVVRSHNYYPTPPVTSADGIASVALGLGRTVMDGGLTVRFSPRYPRHIVQFSDPESTLQYSQKEFYALNLDAHAATRDFRKEVVLEKYDLATAERDGTLGPVASTYSAENHALYEGISRSGTRVVTLAPILNGRLFPLPEILDYLMQLGSWSMNTPVEIEFAVDMSGAKDGRVQFAFLQLRPLMLGGEDTHVDLSAYAPEQLLCLSHKVLGNGIIDNIRDIIVVDRERFNRARTPEIAAEVGRLNGLLRKEHRPYVLIGLGRWGTADPWLGIPVTWDQISGARVIVESGFEDFMVTPSQGTHFFQNITSFQIGYFTVNVTGTNGMVDWQWLSELPAETELQYVRHIRLPKPLTVRMDGHNNRGVITKPQ